MVNRALLVGLILASAGGWSRAAEKEVQGKPDKKGGAASRTAESLISLADSLDPLRSRFNANKDKTRFVALLSPT